jgi:hypothetical protein
VARTDATDHGGRGRTRQGRATKIISAQSSYLNSYPPFKVHESTYFSFSFSFVRAARQKILRGANFRGADSARRDVDAARTRRGRATKIISARLNGGADGRGKKYFLRGVDADATRTRRGRDGDAAGARRTGHQKKLQGKSRLVKRAGQNDRSMAGQEWQESRLVAGQESRLRIKSDIFLRFRPDFTEIRNAVSYTHLTLPTSP